MIDKSGKKNNQRKYLAGEQGFSHQIGIFNDNSAGSLKRILKKKPGQDAAEEEEREAVRAHIRASPLPKYVREYESISRQKHNRVNHAPKNTDERSDIT